MRTLGARGLLSALLLGLAASTGHAADDEDAPKRKSWMPSWNWFAKKKIEAKEGGLEDEPQARPPAPEVLAAARREKEEHAYFRRLAVCDQLMEIALQNSDTEMQRQVEQLKERVWEIYQAQTAARPAGGRFADETVLEQRLGPYGSGQGLLTSPNKGRDARSTAARREK